MTWKSAETYTVLDGEGRAWEIDLLRQEKYSTIRISASAEAVRASAHLDGDWKFWVTASVLNGNLTQAVNAVRGEAQRRIEQADWEAGQHYEPGAQKCVHP